MLFCIAIKGAVNIKKLIVVLASTVFLLPLYSCGNNTNNHNKTNKIVTSKTEHKQKRAEPKKKENNTVNNQKQNNSNNSNTTKQPNDTNEQNDSQQQNNSNNNQNNWIIHNTDEATNYIISQKGDQEWQVMGGTFGGAHSGYDENGNPNSAPKDYIPYITLTNSNNETYVVFADGTIKNA